MTRKTALWTHGCCFVFVSFDRCYCWTLLVLPPLQVRLWLCLQRRMIRDTGSTKCSVGSVVVYWRCSGFWTEDHHTVKTASNTEDFCSSYAIWKVNLPSVLGPSSSLGWFFLTICSFTFSANSANSKILIQTKLRTGSHITATCTERSADMWRRTNQANPYTCGKHNYNQRIKPTNSWKDRSFALCKFVSSQRLNWYIHFFLLDLWLLHIYGSCFPFFPI